MGTSNLQKYLNVGAILGCEFCERLAAFGIGSSLTLFLRSKLGYSIESATIWTAVWGAFATIFSLLGGYLSDAKLGRKRTILCGAFIYFCALLTVSIITYLFELTDDLNLFTIEAIFWISLYIMSVGGGGIKANVGIFGADQLIEFSPNSQLEKAATITSADSDRLLAYDVGSVAVDLNSELNAAELIQTYWNWFYFVINAGALISYTLISYLCQDISFSLGWSIPTIAMFLAICIFLCRSNYYHEPLHDRSMTAQFVEISWYALKNRKRKKQIALDFKQNILNPINDENESEFPRDKFTVSWLDVAKLRFNGEYDNDLVDEVKAVYSVFGFLPFMTLYWIVYAAMNSLFYSQGCQVHILFVCDDDNVIDTTHTDELYHQ